MLFMFILCLMLTGVLSDEICDTLSPYEKCRYHLPLEEIKAIHLVPNKEELMSICPGELKYFECFTDHLDDCGRMNEHYTLVSFMENSYGIAKDLCNEDSALHKAYVQSAECYKTLEGVRGKCEEKAKDFYEVYFDSLKKENPDRIEAIEKSSHKMCMLQSYIIACLSAKVNKECGETADSAMMEVITRSEYLRQFCSQSLMDELSSTFLEELDLEEEEKEIFRYTFSAIQK